MDLLKDHVSEMGMGKEVQCLTKIVHWIFIYFLISDRIISQDAPHNFHRKCEDLSSFLLKTSRILTQVQNCTRNKRVCFLGYVHFIILCNHKGH